MRSRGFPNLRRNLNFPLRSPERRIGFDAEFCFFNDFNFRIDPGYIRLRSCHSKRETASQITVAPISTRQGLWLTKYRLTTRAKMKRPILPMEAPAASIAAAFFPRAAPCKPARPFFCFSCFSIRVAPAGKIAGKAKKSPPTPGPNSFAIMPAPAVINPPKRNRTPNSYQRVFFRAEASILTCIGLLL